MTGYLAIIWCVDTICIPYIFNNSWKKNQQWFNSFFLYQITVNGLVYKLLAEIQQFSECWSLYGAGNSNNDKCIHPFLILYQTLAHQTLTLLCLLQIGQFQSRCDIILPSGQSWLHSSSELFSDPGQLSAHHAWKQNANTSSTFLWGSILAFRRLYQSWQASFVEKAHLQNTNQEHG